MKMTTAVKSSMITLALGALACLLPTTARAQSDMSPDEFAFSAPETNNAQPVQVASANITKAEFEGKVSLPYDVKCGNQNLKAGQYLLSVKSEGTSRVVTINGGGQNMNMRARVVPANQAGSQSALLVRKSSEGRKLAAVYVEGLNATLYLEASTNGSHARMERLPIS
ncbi:MAG: hypothetical protein WAN14_19840 [Candidatus Acidiferrales bacterium]